MFGLYFDDYDTPVFRPPSEANSFILRVTRGCAHNTCTFCAMYKDVQFTVCPDEEISRQIALAAQYARNQVKRIFLADGDALVLPTSKLLKLLARKHREEGTKMSELNAVYTKFPQVLINLTADKEQKQAYKEDEYIAGFIESQQQNLMGMGRVLVRVSGTEPKIRVMVEGEDMEAIQSSAERIADMIRQRIPGVC